MPTTPRNSIVLLLILIASLGLRIWGISWGLPTAHRFSTLYVDEYTPIYVLGNMKPQKFDFNPHYGHNPTFSYYQIGAALGVAHALGLVNIKGSKEYFLQHPEAYARLYIVGRALNVLFGVLLTLLMYRLGRKIGQSELAGLSTALFYAVIPVSVIQCHVMDASVPASFWIAVAFLGLLNAVEKRTLGSLRLAAVLAGLSISTKYTAVPILGAFVFTAWSGRPRLSRIANTGLFLLLGYLIGTPYALLSAREMWDGFMFVADSVGSPQQAAALSRFWYPLAHCYYGIGLPLLGFCLAGLGWALRRRESAAWMAVLFLALSFGVMSRSSLHITRYMNESLPFLLPFGGLAFATVLTRWPRWPVLGGALLLCLWQAPYTLAMNRSLASETDPRDRASDWVMSHVPEGTRMGLEQEANFMMPGHLYMQFWKGIRYPEALVKGPAYVFSVWNPDKKAWDPSPPAYWVETNLFSYRTYKSDAAEADQARNRQLMAVGYHPIESFERNVSFGPFRYTLGPLSGNDWKIYLPRIRIYARGTESPRNGQI